MKKELDKTLESIRHRLELNKKSACNKAYNDGFDAFVEQIKGDTFPMPLDEEQEYFSEVLSEMMCGDDSFYHVDEFNKYVEGWNDAKIVIQEQRAKEQ